LSYENNLNAASHPLDTNGNLTNLGKQSHAYYGDISLGQTKSTNDVQFGYSFEREEQDAIIPRSLKANNAHQQTSLKTGFTDRGKSLRTRPR